MLKFSNTMKKAALVALLGAGLAGSAVVTLAPQVAHAQYYYRDSDDRYYRDWDDRYRRDWDDRYRYHRDWDDRGWVGIGVPGFGVGVYTNPYPYYYEPYCSSYDRYYGYCSY